jgi:diaminohydroxyphosphoribosylaminopyrimidine deaminase/5-amino-6-(5-phosphoribosylamino)uracil reductase
MTPDETWMRHAVNLAERGRGAAEPNPLVGAVVVRDGGVVGAGWHRKYGEPHAEVNALAEAGDAARGATLYVTLEPCCHHGKTPPCTDVVLRSGVRRVVVAISDPFPEVSGKGVAALRAAGLVVEVGTCAAEARRLNAPYLKLIDRAMPYVHAKWAMTLDGKIATRTGDAKWISNDAARRRVHELRGRMDAVVVGIGTVLADDPLLTARPPGPRTPARVVFDSRLRLPVESRLVRTAREAPVIAATADKVDPDRAVALEACGVEVLHVPAPDGRPGVEPLLRELGRRRFTNVLVEGGGTVLGSFLDARAIDEFHVFVAPKLVGGAAAPSPVAGQGVATMAEALSLAEWRVEQIDGDVLLHGWTAGAGSV